MSGERSNLLNPKTMDGPVVKITVADLFKGSDTTFMTYHVMSAGYDFFCPLGVAAGGVLYKSGYRPLPNLLQVMGTAGLIAGGVGATLGIGALLNTAYKGENASPPWNPDGKQMRVNGLSHNFKVRILDLGVWSGIVVAAGAVYAMGGPTKLNLSPGPLGIAQAISLGSAIGSTLSIACITYHESK